jgi:hypothetical protein
VRDFQKVHVSKQWATLTLQESVGMTGHTPGFILWQLWPFIADKMSGVACHHSGLAPGKT